MKNKDEAKNRCPQPSEAWRKNLMDDLRHKASLTPSGQNEEIRRCRDVALEDQHLWRILKFSSIAALILMAIGLMIAFSRVDPLENEMLHNSVYAMADYCGTTSILTSGGH